MPSAIPQDRRYEFETFRHQRHIPKKIHHCCAVHKKLKKLDFKCAEPHREMQELNKMMFILYKLFVSGAPDDK